MKICEKCGAFNSDDKIFCVDCNEKLSEKLTAATERKIRAELSEQMEEMYNKKDPLYVSRFDKVMGAVALVGAVTSAVLMGISVFTQIDIKIPLCALIFFLISVVEALIPKIMWELEKLRLSFTIMGTDGLEPSDFYLKGRKIGVVAGIVLGAIMLWASFL